LPRAFSIARDITATKIVGHGRAPIRRATYIELVVITTEPMAPITRLLRVSCLLPSFSRETFPLKAVTSVSL